MIILNQFLLQIISTLLKRCLSLNRLLLLQFQLLKNLDFLKALRSSLTILLILQKIVSEANPHLSQFDTIRLLRILNLIMKKLTLCQLSKNSNLWKQRSKGKNQICSLVQISSETIYLALRKVIYQKDQLDLDLSLEVTILTLLQLT